MALVTAERLHRWKCVYCGSKDKNIVRCSIKTSNSDPTLQEGVKIVTCNQCGKTEIFSHSALVMAHILGMVSDDITIEQSEKFVKDFHNMNHLDPKVNPHAVVGPKSDILKSENT